MRVVTRILALAGPPLLCASLFQWSSANSLGAEESAPPKLAPAAQGTVDFARDIQPLLSQQCLECHGPAKQKSGLRLDGRAALLAGGDSGPAVVIGKSAESLLIQAVAGTKEDLARMPKGKPALSSDQIALLRAWIDQGLAWSDAALVVKDGAPSGSKHWAFVPPERPQIPSMKLQGWPRNPIDISSSRVLKRKGSNRLRRRIAVHCSAASAWI